MLLIYALFITGTTLGLAALAVIFSLLTLAQQSEGHLPRLEYLSPGKPGRGNLMLLRGRSRVI